VNELSAIGEAVDVELRAQLAELLGAPGRLLEACSYSLFGGGKRVRPALCVLACEACGGTRTRALAAAASLEMIHSYSLVHDDLPAMDDDDLRRGRASCHRAFDEALAILAGDGLLTEAFGVLARGYRGEPSLAVELVALLAQAAGLSGMVGGQALDMSATGERRGEGVAALERCHRMKTGALLRCAVEMGARVAGASPEISRALARFGGELGLLFQVTDDLLDATATTGGLGKTSGKDAEQGKLTYVALLGLPGAQARADELLEGALEALTPLGEAARSLRALARFVRARRR
jgi:geranylgeranyl pyrophosphate synthase